VTYLDYPIAGSSYDTIQLDRLEVGFRQRLGAHTLESMRLEHHEDRLTLDLIRSVTAEVLAEKLPPERVERSQTFGIDFPASPFQHWKQKHATRWWLRRFVRRWPVRTERLTREARLTVNLERYRTYPEANYVLPPDKFGAPYRVAVLREDWRVW
jgi:hypothetical protein